MDPFDEFEFKPLTDGLGFHKKKSEAPAFSDKSFEPLLKNQGPSLSLLDEDSANSLESPLPRKNRLNIDRTPAETSSALAVDEILKTLQNNRRFEFENAKKSLKVTKTKEQYKETTWNMSSTFLDSMLVVAASLLCMIILLMITKTDLIANLSHPDPRGFIYIATGTLFAGVNFIYMLVNRAFLGCTPGEWAFDQRIGKPEEMQDWTYTLRVAGRTLLVMATGFILFPILSALMDYDVVGSITGASLYKKA